MLLYPLIRITSWRLGLYIFKSLISWTVVLRVHMKSIFMRKWLNFALLCCSSTSSTIFFNVIKPEKVLISRHNIYFKGGKNPVYSSLEPSYINQSTLKLHIWKRNFSQFKIMIANVERTVYYRQKFIQLAQTYLKLKWNIWLNFVDYSNDTNVRDVIHTLHAVINFNLVWFFFRSY